MDKYTATEIAYKNGYKAGYEAGLTEKSLLKPCPFCGGIPTDPFYYDPYDGYQGNLGSYIIKCSNCRCEIEKGTKELAIQAWNRRAEDGK